MQPTVDALQGCSVLITRPGEQSVGLAELVKANGAETVIYPVFDIKLNSAIESMRQIIASFDQFDLAIFVSVHAVKAVAHALAKQERGFPQRLKVAAIGPATRSCLNDLGITADYFPERTIDSEGLLEKFSSLDVKNWNTVIFRGQDGRELLATGLRELGAIVKHVEAYRRVLTKEPLELAIEKLQNQGKPLLSVTSVAIMQGLKQLSNNETFCSISDYPLAALSPRIADRARDSGFHGIVEAASSPNDGAMLDALIKCAQQTKKIA